MVGITATIVARDFINIQCYVGCEHLWCYNQEATTGSCVSMWNNPNLTCLTCCLEPSLLGLTWNKWWRQNQALSDVRCWLTAWTMEEINYNVNFYSNNKRTTWFCHNHQLYHQLCLHWNVHSKWQFLDQYKTYTDPKIVTYCGQRTFLQLITTDPDELIQPYHQLCSVSLKV